MSAMIITLPPRKSKAPGQQIADEGTITRLRTIARESADNLILADGPVHPDHTLIDLCGEALYLISKADKMRDGLMFHSDDPYTDAMRHADHLLSGAAASFVQQAKPLMKRIAKIPAQSAAGIYAKALVVQSSRTGAEALARTLAADLVACPGLRECLWPEAGAK
jgi:hypothetical protein